MNLEALPVVVILVLFSLFLLVFRRGIAEKGDELSGRKSSKRYQRNHERILIVFALFGFACAAWALLEDFS
jgi:hypothetical protein